MEVELNKSAIIKEQYLQVDRPQSMYDRQLHKMFETNFSENFAENNDLRGDFLETFHSWLIESKLNSIQGLELFPDKDVSMGVTQFIDDLYQVRQTNIKYLDKEYSYHSRLNPEGHSVDYYELQSGDELILSNPSPCYGDLRPDFDEIIKHCEINNVKVHIDACWFGCVREFKLNLTSPVIESVAFSLSKGLGLGANRIGVRYAKKRWNGPMSIQNDFNMCPGALMWLGIKFINEFGPDFLHKKYHHHYLKICQELDLVPTKAIHIAMKKYPGGEMGPVGLRRILRKLCGE